jgi:hypothetical protein
VDSKVKDAVRVQHANEARDKMGKTLEKIKNEEIGRTKDYMETKCISDCRLQFRIWTNMVELKANMKESYKDGDYSFLGCGDKASVEDQSHVIRCPANSDIRQGLDMEKDKDIVQSGDASQNEEEEVKGVFIHIYSIILCYIVHQFIFILPFLPSVQFRNFFEI